MCCHLLSVEWSESECHYPEREADSERQLVGWLGLPYIDFALRLLCFESPRRVISLHNPLTE